MKRLFQILTGVLALLLLSACAGPTFNSLPLPGTKVSGDTVTFTADFNEALNLTDGAQIKVNGVNSGRVQKVAVHDFRARITMKVKKSAGLKQGATVRLRYTTPLGELFVDVTNPATGEPLADGSHLDTDDTSTAPTVEDALSASSLLINGGGLNHLKVITDESNILLHGREGTIRSLLDRSEYFVTQFNHGKGDLDAALKAMDGAAKVLHERRGVIRRALHEVKPAAAVIQANLDEITAFLRQLEAFGGTANAIVIETRDQILSLIRESGPILQEMARVRGELPATLQAIIRAGAALDGVFPGDWFNLGTHAYLTSLLFGGGGLLGGGLPSPVPVTPMAPRTTTSVPTTKDMPGLTALDNLLKPPTTTQKADGSGSGLAGLFGTLLGGGR